MTLAVRLDKIPTSAQGQQMDRPRLVVTSPNTFDIKRGRAVIGDATRVQPGFFKVRLIDANGEAQITHCRVRENWLEVELMEEIAVALGLPEEVESCEA